MYDHLRFAIYMPEYISELEQSGRLDLTGEFSMTTGLVIDRFRGKHNRYTIKKQKDKFGNIHIAVSGSPHKVAKGTNAIDINWTEFITELKALAANLNIPQQSAFVFSLEFGINIDLPFNAKWFISNILSYRGKQAQINQFDGKGYMLTFLLKEYTLKIYDKGLQVPEVAKGRHILRIELKSRKSRLINKNGIYTLNDLFNISNAIEFQKLFISVINQFVILDSCLLEKKLYYKDNEFILKMLRREVWEDNKFEFSHLDFKAKKRKFQQIHKKYNAKDWNEELVNLVNKKFSTLFPELSIA